MRYGMKLRIFMCERCGKEWESKSKKPLRCGKCKSPYWDIPRKDKAKEVN